MEVLGNDAVVSEENAVSENMGQAVAQPVNFAREAPAKPSTLPQNSGSAGASPSQAHHSGGFQRPCDGQNDPSLLVATLGRAWRKSVIAERYRTSLSSMPENHFREFRSFRGSLFL